MADSKAMSADNFQVETGGPTEEITQLVPTVTESDSPVDVEDGSREITPDTEVIQVPAENESTSVMEVVLTEGDSSASQSGREAVSSAPAEETVPEPPTTDSSDTTNSGAGLSPNPSGAEQQAKQSFATGPTVAGSDPNSRQDWTTPRNTGDAVTPSQPPQTFKSGSAPHTVATLEKRQVKPGAIIWLVGMLCIAVMGMLIALGVRLSFVTMTVSILLLLAVTLTLIALWPQKHN